MGKALDYMKMLKSKGKLTISMELDMLDLYCEYLLNYDNKAISFSNLSNLKEYMERVNPDNFKTNESKMARYFFITYYLEARMDKGIVTPKLIFKYIDNRVSKRYQAIIKREILDSMDHNRLPSKDIETINSMIFSQLNTIFMHEYEPAILALLKDISSNEFGKEADSVTSAITLFQAVLTDLTKVERRSKKDDRFNLTDADHFNAMCLEAIERAQSSSHYLQTGWQGLNKMLNGGFEDARLYNFIGATGGFKSGLLLNLMKQIKLYNKARPHKDPTKRATILFISQENNMWETIMRIWGIFGTTDNIKNYEKKDAMKIMNRGGFRTVVDDEDIDIEFIYRGNQAIGVPDIKGIVQELENAGKEVIVVIQDYIERLRPPTVSADKRNQLADVSNQLHDLAIELDIPIITASQFNRDGVDIIEQAREKGNVDIGRKVGSGNISESFGMLKNFDMNISIVVEYDATDERYYLSFRRLKFRGDDSTSIEYFLQPFKSKNSKIQLQDDIHTDPVYRLSMLDEISANIREDLESIQDITRTRSILEPINDPDEKITEDFMGQMFTDIDKSKASQDDVLRDEDGFIILIHRTELDSKATLSKMGINFHEG